MDVNAVIIEDLNGENKWHRNDTCHKYLEATELGRCKAVVCHY